MPILYLYCGYLYKRLRNVEIVIFAGGAQRILFAFQYRIFLIGQPVQIYLSANLLEGRKLAHIFNEQNLIGHFLHHPIPMACEKTNFDSNVK
jgi:hypothetical protein